MVTCALKKKTEWIQVNAYVVSNFKNPEMDILITLVEERRKIIGMFTFV